jgi:hypothetical protein
MNKTLSLIIALSFLAMASYEQGAHKHSTLAAQNEPGIMIGFSPSRPTTQPATRFDLVQYGNSRPVTPAEMSPRVTRRAYRSRPVTSAEIHAAKRSDYRSRPVTWAEIRAAKKTYRSRPVTSGEIRAAHRKGGY